MLGKQVITVAAVLGILGCGACFLSDAADRTPPPPPPLPTPAMLHIDLYGVRTIAVVVTNSSELRRLDAALLQAAVVKTVGYDGKQWKLRIAPANDATRADAVLKVEILDESELPGGQVTGSTWKRWGYRIHSSAELMARDGRVLWSETNHALEFPNLIEGETVASASRPMPYRWIREEFSYSLAHRLFYGETR